MNGPTKYVLDTCAATFLVKKDKRMLPVLPALDNGKQYVSVITRMELHAEPSISAEKLADIDAFLAAVVVVPFDDAIENVAVKIRREFKPKIKLPDCLVAATTIVIGATLLTDDARLKDLVWPGYSVRGI
jgi:predicted nucleic acid-binding protein